MKAEAEAALIVTLNKATFNISENVEEYTTTIKEKYSESIVRTKLFSFGKKIDIKLKKAAEKVETFLNDKLDDTEIENVIAEANTRNTEL